ncbi:telomere length and silencing protein 1 homolog [Amphibalanus amphitrite]|uniref:telomere length and silencing protein 1 homolog n=1 Tax=Amphibalanus amphitrite TaxID=1232801 RepID=UPI001C924CD9|nr:telomere length and silencing protein 1 homolog [Amphibalanus amphitrite]
MFKKVKKKPLRERKASSESDEAPQSDDEELSLAEKLEEARELQKLRKKASGIDIETLAKGDVKKDAKKKNDPFKKTTGGMVDLAAVKKGAADDTDDAYDTGIGTSFSAETNKRDEDAEMQKYIETELQKRRGVQENEDDQQNSYLTPEQAALMAVPEHLRKSSNKKSEEMLSNQMLSGIPEIDLGIDAKLKNIEATEAAKMKLLQDQMNKKSGPSQFVPTNMAVNFVQHNRFSIKEPLRPKRAEQRPEPKKPVLVVGGVREDDEETERKRKHGQASDDLLFNKFKKQFRR